MAVYTRTSQNAPQFAPSSVLTQTSPHLVFQKWQVYDRFIKEYDNRGNPLIAFETKSTRLTYLQNIEKLCDAVYQVKYATWFAEYQDCVQKLGVRSVHYNTLWRLIVGWSSNPTLESGITLHHLLGFPYIPGSSVKGLLHYVAETELLEKASKLKSFEEKETSASIEEKSEIEKIVRHAELIKELFGSIHIERGSITVSNEKQYFGPKSLKEILNDFLTKTEGAGQWKEINEKINKLINENTGGMISLYDAVPLPGQNNLLQTDILNPHYPDYYNSDSVPPSDDQNPKPIYFLAVKPKTEFYFYYKVCMPKEIDTDDEGIRRKRVLEENSCTKSLIETQIENWLNTSLGLYGIGAKTASGYGYFDTPVVVEMTKKAALAKSKQNVIKEEKPPSGEKSQKTVEQKITDLPRAFSEELWLKIASSPNIDFVIGLGQKMIFLGGKKNPEVNYKNNGSELTISYTNNNVELTVKVKLIGINSLDEAKYVWEHDIKPELQK